MEELNRQIQRRVKLRFVFLGIHLPADAAQQLRHLCHPYRHASFTELTRPAAQIDGLFSSKLSAKHSLEIDIRRPCPAGVIGRPVDLLVIIRNYSDETIPAGSRLYLNPNGYFRPTFAELPEIPVDRVHGQVVRACPRGRVTVSDLQERCEVSIQDRDRTAIATQPFFLVRRELMRAGVRSCRGPDVGPCVWSGHGGLHRRAGQQEAPNQGPQPQPLRHRGAGLGQRL